MWTASDRTARRLAVIALSTAFASSVMSALSPVILQKLVDHLSHGAARKIAFGSAFLILLYVVSLWLAKVLRELQEMFLGRADQRLNRRLSTDYFQHLISLPLSYHLDRRTGALSQTLTDGLRGYRIILQHLVNSVLPLVIEFAAMSVILVLLGHAIFLGITAISIASYIVAFWIGVIVISTPARRASIAHIDAGAVFADSVMNLETIKYFRGESRLGRRFRAAARRTERCWRKIFARRMTNGIVVASIFGLTLGVSVYVAAEGFYTGRMTIGEFVLVNAYILQMVRPVEAMGFALRDIAQGRAFIDRMSALLNVKDERHLATGNGRPMLHDAALAFEDVFLAYEGDRFVLRGFNLLVRPGMTLAVVGRSGSGKSSLVRLLMRLVEPTGGRIRIGGESLSDISLTALRDAISVVPQDTILFNDSIAFNIAIGRRRSTTEDVVAAAKVAGIHEFIVGLPDGYETKVGERGLRLSGGERQRVAIARAAIRKPQMYIFDEATSSLDPETENAIVRSLIGIAGKATTIVISHRLITVVHADEIVVLDDGAIVEKGTHESLIAQAGLYAAMWRVQRGYLRNVHEGIIRVAG
jgi:ATP-binding cassette subfamily B protein